MLFYASCQAQGLSQGEAVDFYVKDYSTYPDFPTACIGDVFQDQKGQLWITTCGSPTEMTQELFSFDGYAFTSYYPEFPRAVDFFSYTGLYHNKLFSHYKTPNAFVWSYYSLDEHKTVTYDSIGHTQSLKEYDFIKQSLRDSTFYSYIYKDGQMQLLVHDKDLKRTAYPPLAVQDILEQGMQAKDLYVQQLFYYKQWVIYYKPSNNAFRLINLKNAEVKTISNTLVDVPFSHSGSLFYDLESTPILKLVTDQGVRVLQLQLTNVGPEALSLVLKTEVNRNLAEDFFEFSESLSYFEDRSGNILETYTESGALRVRLLSRDGKIYDLSGIVETIEENYVVFIKGANFLEHFYLSTNRHFYQLQIILETYVKSYTAGVPARSMVELVKDTLLIKYQDFRKPYGILTREGISNGEALNLCHFENITVDRTEDAVWGISGFKLARYDIARKSCEIIDKGPEVKQLNYAGDGRLIVLDESNRYWVYVIDQNRFEPLLQNGVQIHINSSFQDFMVDADGLLWVVCDKGLFKYDFESASLVHVNSLVNDFDFNLNAILQISKEEFLLGSFHSGVVRFNKTDYSFKIIDSGEGLSHNTVASITPDNEGNYWVGTYNGVSVLDSNFEVIGNLYEADGLVHNECNRLSSIRLENGNIAIGTLNGISIIQPEASIAYIRERAKPHIYFTKVDYFDESADAFVPAKSKTSLDLSPADNRLHLEFALTSYMHPHKATYAYKIEGVDKDWIDLKHRNSISFDNLSSGNYTILIKGENHNNIQSANVLTLNVNVGAYFYEQFWFYAVLFIVIFAIVLVWVFTLKKKIQQATSKIEKDKNLIEAQAIELKKLDAAKSDFFTNITHEFRTPLTIITSSIDFIKTYSSERINKDLQSIEYSTQNLLRKINMILDLRKLESDKLNITNIQSDVISYIQDITDAHQNMALQKDITITLKSQTDQFVMDFDPEKLEAVVSNLLTNAIKYTPKGGKIVLSLGQNTQADKFLIKVIDKGYGIPEDEQEAIFENFYRFKPEGSTQIGTGIGLSLTKKLVELMHGQIEVTSEVNKGTTFSVKLPVSRKATCQENPTLVFDDLPRTETNEITYSESKTPAEDSASILIVEDNPELRQLLKAQLSAYRLYTAKDGEEGIALAQEHVPDIIISDVMMPKKDGYELCKALKNHLTTSHIPVILLTAKADQDSKLQGLEIKADAYLYKPYDLRELKLILKNLIDSREQLQIRLRQLQDLDAYNSQSLEDKFITQIRMLVRQNLQNEDFGYKEIQEYLNISTTQMYKKINALTGLSVGNFILLIRLQEACNLLQETEMNIKEITFSIGLNSPSYFSRKFKEEFGMTPSEWREAKVKGKIF
jgi:signal transduction histidine kinase/DNA-binding response OmpR family regulator/sugar lactone lactonase YvrE